MPTIKTGDQKHVVTAPPSPPRVHVASFHSAELEQLPSDRLADPSGPGFRSALLGSPLPRSLRLRLFPELQATSCGEAPGAGCRCRTGRRLRGRPSGAQQLSEGRRAASGTDGEWRGARRPPQVRKAGTLGRVGASAPGGAPPATSLPRGPWLRFEVISTPFRKTLVPVPLPFLEQSSWQSRFFRRAPLAAVGVHIPSRFAARSPPAPASDFPRDPTSVPLTLASPRSAAGCT